MAEPELLQVKAIMAELEGRVESACIEISMEITDALKEATPVDTGFAKANWRPTTGAPATRAVGAPGSPGSAQSVQAAAIERLQAYKLEQGRIYISNPTRYIGRIVSDGQASMAVAVGLNKARFGRR